MEQIDMRNRKLMGKLSEKEKQILGLKGKIAELREDLRAKIATKIESEPLNSDVKKLLKDLPPAVSEIITAAANERERPKKSSLLMDAAALIAEKHYESKNTFVAIVEEMGFCSKVFGF